MINPINNSYTLNLTTSFTSVHPKDLCFPDITGRIPVDCLTKQLCTQLDNWIVHTGITLIIVYILSSWLLWWFFNYGYKKLNYDSGSDFIKFIGDLRIRDNRIFWDIWLRNKLTTAMVIYIGVIVYFNF